MTKALFDLYIRNTKEKIIKDLTDLNIDNMWERAYNSSNKWVDIFKLELQEDYSVIDKIFDIMKQDIDIVEIIIKIHHIEHQRGPTYYNSTELFSMVESTKYDKIKELIRLKFECSIVDLHSSEIELGFMHHHLNLYID